MFVVVVEERYYYKRCCGPAAELELISVSKVGTMTDDFLRLVSQANPAARRYQPASNGYPPSGSTVPYSDDQSPQLMDPFFDDEDDNAPDSTFGRPAPMQSQESGLPLAHSAAPPAGVGGSKISLGGSFPQGWNFDDDDFRPADEPASSGSASFPRLKHQPHKPPISKTWKWKWPWRKEKVSTGERIIALNSSAANADFCSNFISTSKYNVLSFAPKFLFGMYAHSVHTETPLSQLQNNFRNMRTCSSYSLRASNKYQAYRQLINTLPLPLWLLCFWLPRSKRCKKIW